ncbi:MAG: hypothetical protein J1E80_06650 [Desulfovibrionaceae bacterium]|nr:hypothetical protein [Desulfovibrionaceae bacterium]
MKRKIYLASSWQNPMQPHAVNLLRLSGHEVYDFRKPLPGKPGFSWDVVDKDWKHWTSQGFITGLAHPRARNAYQLDKYGLDWADTCIVLLDCGKSAHLEAGYAIGQGKETFFVLEQQGLEQQGNVKAELMYLLAGEDHVFASLVGLLERL